MSVLDQIYEKAKRNPQRIAFPEALNEKMMQAAYETGKEGYIIPVLVGYGDEIRMALSEKGYEESIFTIVDIREETYKKSLIDRYVDLPQAMLKEKALNRRMQNPLYYAMVMQAVDEADVTFAGIDNTTGDVLLAGQMVIGRESAPYPVSDYVIFRDSGEAKEAFWRSVTALCAPIRMRDSWRILRFPPVIR